MWFFHCQIKNKEFIDGQDFFIVSRKDSVYVFSVLFAEGFLVAYDNTKDILK